MSDTRRPNIYHCPYIETCIFPVDEVHFKGTTSPETGAVIIPGHCREYSATVKHPQYLQCQGYQQMNDLPRNWYKRIYKQGQDAGMQIARGKGIRV